MIIMSLVGFGAWNWWNCVLLFRSYLPQSLMALHESTGAGVKRSKLVLANHSITIAACPSS